MRQRCGLAGCGGQLAQILHVCSRGLPGCGAERLEHLFHRGHVGGHLAGQADLGECVEAEQHGLLPAEPQNAGDQRTVVEFAFGGLAEMGAVQPLSQIAAAAMLHERYEAGQIERNPPRPGFRGSCRFAVLLVVVVRLGRQLQQAFRQAFHVAGVGQDE